MFKQYNLILRANFSQQTARCRCLSPSMGCMGCIGAGCLQGPRGGAHSPDRLSDVAVYHPPWGWGVLERGVYGALRPTAQTDCRMSLSVTLYGGGVYGVYWGGVFTGLSGPQPRLTVGCCCLSPCMGAGCMGCIGAGCLRGSQAHSPD